jgi:hypothetical protein
MTTNTAIIPENKQKRTDEKMRSEFSKTEHEHGESSQLGKR